MEGDAPSLGPIVYSFIYACREGNYIS